jgi:tetratricopeptide (TPR) repeat protein
MTVAVRFQLRRAARGGPAAALFLPSREPAALLEVCSRLGLDPSGRVYDVAGGFVLKLALPTTEPFPGAVRLRELAPDFYLPVDADLIPALLEDEANGLVRDGGLVFLPGGRILRFDRRGAVELREVLSVEPRPRRAWSALPEPRRVVERVVQIARESPKDSAEALYQEFEQDLRDGGSRTARSRGGSRENADDAEPGGGGPSGEGEDLDRAADRTNPNPAGAAAGGEPAGDSLPVGPGLVPSLWGWLGQAGAGFAALREKLRWEWVDHSTLVRKLLREFREGDPSRALQHALSMVPADARQRRVGWGKVLPWNRAIYKLLDLLERPARGQPVGVWRAQPDLVQELTWEYHKAAERAVREGDFRRAAYIYGKLLGQDRMAAIVLQRGGLHRDAAILYEKKLNDPAAAAQAFEAAGEVDRAIALYRRIRQHERAADLLRRIGEEDAAIAEYQRAAELLTAARPPDHRSAGLLFLNKARRLDLAIDQFQRGWDRRPEGNPTFCALELARLHAQRGSIEPIRRLLDEADAFFESPGSDKTASLFYNGVVARLAGIPEIESFAEEVRDRAVLALARKLRQGIEAGCAGAPLVSTLFGGSGAWPAAVRSDADFTAIAAAQRSRARDARTVPEPWVERIPIGGGTVTAACQAAVTGELFLGLDSGMVVGYQPGRNYVVPVAALPLPVTGLAVDPGGQTVVALQQVEDETVMSCCVKSADGSFRSRPGCFFPVRSRSWLTPILPWGMEWLVGMGDGDELVIVDAGSGLRWRRLTTKYAAQEPPRTALLLPIDAASGTPGERFVILTHDGPRWILLDVDGHRRGRSDSCWCPADPSSGSSCSVPLTWRHVPPFIELVGLDQHGAVHATRFEVRNGLLDLLASRVASIDGGYLAATRSGASTVIAVSRTRINWFSTATDRFQPIHQLKLSLPSAVACFPSTSPREVLVVGSDGFIARIAAPRRVDSATNVR